MQAISGIGSLLLVSTLLAAVWPCQAQVNGAIDGTKTIVNQAGNTFTITGGTIAGSNLFQSFQQFGLTQEQTANFLASPGIQNILARVTGGDASVINGLLQVSGSTANLYLMNSAGIVFGAKARLDVAGSFIATTANGIGFGDKWLNAAGTNDYATLLGQPDRFAFTVLQPGAIVNAGILAVGANQGLLLLGGTVVNTGQLIASSGQITIATVSGQSLVRLSQPGSLLSFELAPLPSRAPRPAPGEMTAATPQPNAWTLPIASLPALLTGGIGVNATGFTVNQAGVVALTGSGLAIEPGDVVAGHLTAGTATLAATHNLTLVESQLQTTGDLSLLATNTVRLRDSAANPTILQAGKTLLIRGNQGVDLFALNHPASGLFSGGDTVLRSANPIRSDVHYVVGGNLKFEDLNGKAGTLFSLNDPVILAAGDVTMGDYTGASLHILAGGSVTLGAIVIDNVDTTANTINPANPNPALASLASLTRADGSPLYVNVTPTLDSAGNVQRLPQASHQLVINGSTRPTLDVRAGINWAALGGVPGQSFFPNPFPPGTATTGPTLTAPPSSADLTIASISIANVFDTINGIGRSNTVLLTNQYVPNLALAGGAIRVWGQSFLLPTGEPDPKGITAAGIYLNNAPGVVVIDSRSSITSGNIIARPSSIDLRAVGNITTGDLAASAPSQTSQDSVVLVSKTGNIVVNTIDAGSNGIDVQAGGLFQAIAAVNNVLDGQEFFSINVLPQPGTDLRAFLDQKGITVAPNTSIPISFPQQPIVSLIARPQSPTQTGKAAGSLNAPITITYGGGTRLILDQTIPVFHGLDPANPGIPTVGRIIIRGNNEAFYAGSVVTPFLPITSDAFLSRNNVTNTYEPVTAATNVQFGLYRNHRFAPLSFGSVNFPNTASGVTAAIVIGGGNDNAFYGATQNQIFPPVVPLAPGENAPNAATNGLQLGTAVLVTEQRVDNPSQNGGCRPASNLALDTGSATAQPAGRAASSPASNPCVSARADDALILQILDSAPKQTKALEASDRARHTNPIPSQATPQKARLPKALKLAPNVLIPATTWRE
ncbi:filamentous hemagglutinin N-terminal domain-containing protein [Stenomitos frigidus]|nr:filamentous hemagglutinin N-terminal domain-containing protein [Stenomitos frigidus]